MFSVGKQSASEGYKTDSSYFNQKKPLESGYKQGNPDDLMLFQTSCCFRFSQVESNKM